MPDRTRPLEDVLDDFGETVDQEGTTVGALVHAFEDRPLGVLLTLLSGVLLIPFVGGIPGLPDVAATLMLIFIVQSWVGQKGIWLPKFIANRDVGYDRLKGALSWARPYARRVDSLLKQRLVFLVRSWPARIVISLICAALAFSIYFLGFIPFAMLPAAAAIFAFGLALIGRDGLLALAGYLFTGGTVWLLFRVI
ncbi:exopolysaccharide biosynthesis protein [Pontivivens ytuae]|uniref:Exopolysaccharide biosynthesis protein n=1 Tax=Pontivivens ytuae TaxID=2789856 RepID=A0A7S9QB65_9RHOB|nr:exopolysaccharide biosynthesis protein [Pontivivens ytuae]QPH52848.1 exopolysaccharide biosynthesis protein [Pontivivens ytuae]